MVNRMMKKTIIRAIAYVKLTIFRLGKDSEYNQTLAILRQTGPIKVHKSNLKNKELSEEYYLGVEIGVDGFITYSANKF